MSLNDVIDKVSSEQENPKIDEEIILKTRKNSEPYDEIKENFESKNNDFFHDEIEGICELEIEFILKGVNKGRSFRFSDKNENITIGSDEFSTIFIKDPCISLLHGTIKYLNKE